MLRSRFFGLGVCLLALTITVTAAVTPSDNRIGDEAYLEIVERGGETELLSTIQRRHDIALTVHGRGEAIVALAKRLSLLVNAEGVDAETARALRSNLQWLGAQRATPSGSKQEAFLILVAGQHPSRLDLAIMCYAHGGEAPMACIRAGAKAAATVLDPRTRDAWVSFAGSFDDARAAATAQVLSFIKEGRPVPDSVLDQAYGPAIP